MAADCKMLKVLVIHGYRQNAKASREKTGSFRKGLKKYLDLVYITAPNQIKSSAENTNEESNEFGWWFSKQQDEQLSFSAHEISDVDHGHNASVELIKQTFETQGPFDGILGFSQGATMAAHICSLRELKDSPYKFNFSILCAGFKSRSKLHEKYYENKITCPTLHVYGDTDKVIPKEMSLELQDLFVDSTTLNHAGGHYLPATANERKVYQTFLDRFRC